MQIDQGFPPLLNDKSKAKVLVLGTLPGVRSLQDVEYYAHPQNSFWWIMSQIFGFEASLSYPIKSDLVTSQGLMIWDVIHSCHRPGSLDSSIDQETLIPNNFHDLFQKQNQIRLVAFNGQAARKLFKKHVEANAEWKLPDNISFKVMPSTSPAYAAMKREQKLSVWQELINYL